MKLKIIIAALLALLLTGCAQSGEPITLSHFTVQREQTEISLDALATPILEALGAPFGYTERCPNPRFGVERTYRFAGLNLQTYQAEDGDRVRGILLTDESMQTEEGITVGSTAEEVRACYGQDAIQDNCCIVTRSTETMTLLLQNNVVTVIQYALA